MTAHARAILWAQWRSLLNYYPKVNKTGLAFGGVLAGLWYAGWIVFAVFVAWVFAGANEAGLARTVLPSGLLLIFLYWQLVPILLMSTGVSLSTRKLQVYPIPHSQLFLIEVLLRLSTSLEMILVMGGLGAGLLANRRWSRWSAAALCAFGIFNLCLAAGARELMVRIFERKRVREIAVLLLVMLGAIPQLLAAMGLNAWIAATLSAPSLPIWPWSATASIAAGPQRFIAVFSLLAWTLAAYRFGRWQFERTLRFDAGESNATNIASLPRTRRLFDRLMRWPSLLFGDPLAALIEKEIRFLSRAPRFRLVFAMGFTFGLVIWLPLALGKGHSRVFGMNYLTFTCVYALILLGDVCFWNTFGFDRGAAQTYWAMPVRFSTVLAGKNIAALFFVLLEITAISSVCALLRMPLTATRVLEAYGSTLVAALYLISLGNLTSTAGARPVDPAKAMRSGRPGRLQAVLFLIYPIAAGPVLLAYVARYAFESEAAFFVVLAVSAAVGAAVYWVSLDSAVAAAERNKERLLEELGRGESVMQA